MKAPNTNESKSIGCLENRRTGRMSMYADAAIFSTTICSQVISSHPHPTPPKKGRKITIWRGTLPSRWSGMNSTYKANRSRIAFFHFVPNPIQQVIFLFYFKVTPHPLKCIRQKPSCFLKSVHLFHSSFTKFHTHYL